MIGLIAAAHGGGGGGSSNIIPDPGFASPSSWNAGTGWTVRGGKATAVNGNVMLPIGVTVANGQAYDVSFDVSGHTPSGAALTINLGAFGAQVVLPDAGAVQDGPHSFPGAVADTTTTNDIRIDGGGFWNGSMKPCG